ncbi:putative ATP-dependent rRNA helicase spb4 [Blattamonas nauphoetae]|uniref:ATP-dependent RNA helicase n=1 Tax=Blattamonas nauphoetae TaxID=2049346 RepID=A0ABQ9Y9Z5_9EUKA|nr:putative ATP-dependent rRNA helicase spb4 [Blattamonas nauphoetae]
MSTFLPDFPLSEPVRKTLASRGFVSSKPVQTAVIPILLEGHDVVVEAMTGSGKTLCYSIPLIERLINTEPQNGMIRAIILLPTRMLVEQVVKEFKLFQKHAKHLFSVFQATGGDENAQGICNELKRILIPSEPQMIVIGTIGCMLKIVHSSISMSSVDYLVLDEADNLMKTQSFDDTKEILSHIPAKKRTTALFSATMGTNVTDLIDAGLKKYFKIRVSNKGAILQNELVDTDLIKKKSSSDFSGQKYELPTVEVPKSSLFPSVFSTILKSSPELDSDPFSGVNFLAIHGGTAPKKQSKILSAFNSSKPTDPIHKLTVLFTTDLCARGVDFTDCGWIIQFDAPQSPDTFVHRIGRSGRMEKEGKSIVLLSKEEDSYVYFMQLKALTLREWHGFDPTTSPIPRLSPLDLLAVEAAARTKQNQSNVHSELFELLGAQVDCPYLSVDGEVLVDLVVPFAAKSSISALELFSAPDLVTALIRRAQLKDRKLFDLAQRAFVSFVRGVKVLDWVGVMTMFALLKFPRMPELKHIKEGRFRPLPLDFKTKWIQYEEADREKERRRDLKKNKFDRPIQKPKAGEKPSIQKGKRVKKQGHVFDLQDEAEIEEDYKKLKKGSRGGRNKKKKRNFDDSDDSDDLMSDLDSDLSSDDSSHDDRKKRKVDKKKGKKKMEMEEENEEPQFEDSDKMILDDSSDSDQPPPEEESVADEIIDSEEERLRKQEEDSIPWKDREALKKYWKQESLYDRRKREKKQERKKKIDRTKKETHQKRKNWQAKRSQMFDPVTHKRRNRH